MQWGFLLECYYAQHIDMEISMARFAEFQGVLILQMRINVTQIWTLKIKQMVVPFAGEKKTANTHKANFMRLSVNQEYSFGNVVLEIC